MKCSITRATATGLLLVLAAPMAASAPLRLDSLYNPYFGGHVKHEGYLEFINPTEHPNLIGTSLPSTPPGVIQTEEYTGYTDANGNDIIEQGDSDTTAGDRADFDWVQENRACETNGSPAGSDPNTCNNAGVRPGGVNHPGQVGAMGWTIGTPETSPHVDPGTGAAHAHSDEENPPGALPHLDNDAYAMEWFHAVDVFSIISFGQDDGVDLLDPASLEAAALDYVLDFGNSVTGAFSPGVLSVLWIPGWTNATYIDNYVARWVPQIGGNYDLVAIEPIGDDRTEIDAIKGLYLPEPGTTLLLAIGLAGLAGWQRRASAATAE